MFSFHFVGLNINEIIHYVNWGFVLWRVWHSLCIMDRSFTSPLVFISPNSSFQVMTVPKLCNFHAITFRTDLSMLLVCWNMKPTPCDICCIFFTVAMDPVVRIEPNGCQALLSHDDAIEHLKAHGWDVFLKKFEGYKLLIAQDFAQNFDGFRAKVGDVQLEIT
jgi:hypothetical protein